MKPSLTIAAFVFAIISIPSASKVQQITVEPHYYGHTWDWVKVAEMPTWNGILDIQQQQQNLMLVTHGF